MNRVYYGTWSLINFAEENKALLLCISLCYVFPQNVDGIMNKQQERVRGENRRRGRGGGSEMVSRRSRKGEQEGREYKLERRVEEGSWRRKREKEQGGVGNRRVGSGSRRRPGVSARDWSRRGNSPLKAGYSENLKVMANFYKINSLYVIHYCYLVYD